MKQTIIPRSYESPEITVVEVSVECGYELSVGGTTFPDSSEVNPPLTD